MNHFDGESAEVADYLSHFERVAKWNGWSHEEKGIQLAMNLREAARKVLGCLTDFEVDDYDVLCSVLKMKFSPKERCLCTEVSSGTERSLTENRFLILVSL